MGVACLLPLTVFYLAYLLWIAGAPGLSSLAIEAALLGGRYVQQHYEGGYAEVGWLRAHREGVLRQVAARQYGPQHPAPSPGEGGGLLAPPNLPQGADWLSAALDAYAPFMGIDARIALLVGASLVGLGVLLRC